MVGRGHEVLVQAGAGVGSGIPDSDFVGAGAMNHWRILVGDVREQLATLPDASVQCCVTSPPYWGLRSYLPKGHEDKHREIGSEPTPEAFVETMVEVFREVRRVLHPSGTCWLNLGTVYAGGGRGALRPDGHGAVGPRPRAVRGRRGSGKGAGKRALSRAGREKSARFRRSSVHGVSFRYVPFSCGSLIMISMV